MYIYIISNETVEVNVVRLLAGYTLYDNEIYKEIREELDTHDLNKIIVDYCEC
jgi:hypothetical protein